MKNKYLEIEILPFPVLPESNPGFTVRNLNKEYQAKKEKTSYFKKISSYIIKTSAIFLLVFFPLFSTGQVTVKQEIVKLTNIERVKHHLKPLTVNLQLEQAAQEKALDMLTNKYFSHTSPSGLTPWNFISENGYAYKFAGENLAMDFSEAKKVFAAWLRSPTHRDNILDPDFKEIGVATVKGIMENRETVLTVQFFGAK